MTITHYPLLSAILLLVVGSGIVSSVFRLFCLDPSRMAKVKVSGNMAERLATVLATPAK